MKNLNIFAVGFLSSIIALNSAEARVLKKRVDVKRLEGRAFAVPGGQTLDFPYLVNLQFPYVLAEHGAFVQRDASGGQPSGVSVTAMTAPWSEDFQILSQYHSETEMQTLATTEQPLPACLEDLPMAAISGAMTGFDFTGGFTGKFGFDPAGSLGPITGIGATVDVKRTTLSMNLSAVDPLKGVAYTGAAGKSTETQLTIDASVDFSKFHINPRYFYQSPLAQVIRQGILKTLTALDEAMNKIEPWHSYVYKTRERGSETFVIFRGGERDVGIKAGDVFAIQSLQYDWSGTPCKSTYNGRMGRKIAEVEVISQGSDFLSEARVIPGSETDVTIRPGDKVVLVKLSK